MKSILLIGAGGFGKHLAEKLIELKYEVMVIDRHEELINDILPIVTTAQIGDCTDVDVLSNVDVESFDSCFVTIRKSFQDSLETTSLLKELGAKRVVSFASNEVQEKFLLRNGADAVIFPEKQFASWTAMRYATDNIFDYVRLDDEHSMFEVAAPDYFAGKTIAQLAIRQKHGINIIAIKKGNILDVSLTADTVISAGERLLVIGSIKNIKKCFDV
ncbi:MAG: TrkA family potassium uptake protein [Clostridia bacterium]|nr:TrkA family potassium uptake protein [Clostridia bacterium]